MEERGCQVDGRPAAPLLAAGAEVPAMDARPDGCPPIAGSCCWLPAGCCSLPGLSWMPARPIISPPLPGSSPPPQPSGCVRFPPANTALGPHEQTFAWSRNSPNTPLAPSTCPSVRPHPPADSLSPPVSVASPSGAGRLNLSTSTTTTTTTTTHDPPPRRRPCPPPHRFRNAYSFPSSLTARLFGIVRRLPPRLSPLFAPQPERRCSTELRLLAAANPATRRVPTGGRQLQRASPQQHHRCARLPSHDCLRRSRWTRHDGFVFVKCRRCPLPCGEEDWRGFIRCHFRGNQSVEQPASCHQICEPSSPPHPRYLFAPASDDPRIGASKERRSPVAR